jgi:hypothetical protein
MKQLAKVEVLYQVGEEVDPRFGRLNRWTFLMMQIFESKRFLDLVEGRHAVQSDSSIEDLLVAQALFRCAVTSYAKCFTQAGASRSKLEGPVVFAGQAALLETHERLMALRHRYAAHNGMSGLDEAVVDVQELPDKFIIGTRYAFAIPLHEFQDYRSAIECVESYLVDQVAKITAGLERKFGKPIVNRNA